MTEEKESFINWLLFWKIVDLAFVLTFLYIIVSSLIKQDYVLCLLAMIMIGVMAILRGVVELKQIVKESVGLSGEVFASLSSFFMTFLNMLNHLDQRTLKMFRMSLQHNLNADEKAQFYEFLQAHSTMSPEEIERLLYGSVVSDYEEEFAEKDLVQESREMEN